MTTRDVCVQTCPVLLRSLLVELQSVAVYPDVHDYAHVTRADKCVNAQHDYYRRLDGASPHDHAYAVGTTTATFDAPPFTPNNTSSFVGSDHFLSTTLQSMFADDTRDEAVQCENVDDFNHFIDYITQPPTPPCSNTATSKPSPPQRRSHGLFEKRLPRTTRRSCRLDERMTLSATQCSTGTSTQTEIMSSRKKQSKRSTDTARACASKLLGCAWQACAHSSSTSLEQLHAHLDNMHVSADDDGQFACGWTSCSMTFARRYLIVRHLRTHTGHRPYVCTVCARACATPERLRLHMRAAHTGTTQQIHVRYTATGAQVNDRMLARYARVDLPPPASDRVTIVPCTSASVASCGDVNWCCVVA
jgi:hypothetical protein